MTYTETLDYLFNQLPMYQRIGKAAYKADLSTTLKLDEYFRHPHRKFKSIHVAGTNGKGSTSHMLAAVLQKAGYKVGLYTSPHLKDFRERIKINGELIFEEEVVDFIAKHHKIFEEVKSSFFEMTAALAFDYFARQQVDIAVVEVGMGGRLDSTNIISPLLSVITNIGFDHMEFLGNTIAAIAAEKAGIIKQNIPVVIGEWNDESATVFQQKAKEQNAPITFADKQFGIQTTSIQNGKQCFELSLPADCRFQQPSYSIDLLGSYQSKNVLTALAAINSLLQHTTLSIPQEAISEGLLNAATITGLMGRWQILSQHPLCICDTGHNAHGLEYSMKQLQQLNYDKLYFVFGVVNDKDLSSVLPLLPKSAYYFFTRANLPRALDAHILTEICTKYGLKGEVAEPVAAALNEAKKRATADDVIFIGGSTFVVAEVV